VTEAWTTVSGQGRKRQTVGPAFVTAPGVSDAGRTTGIGAGGAPGDRDTVYTGPSGDARGSSQGRILDNEFLGDYVYAIATRTYGVGVWDVR
jgi:hypothetical protein